MGLMPYGRLAHCTGRFSSHASEDFFLQSPLLDG